MKKLIALLLSVCCLLAFAVPAFALAPTGDTVIKYELSCDNGSPDVHDITVEKGEVITVVYTITASELCLTSTTQDQIVYDPTFFELVTEADGTTPCIYKEATYASTFTTSNPIETDGTHFIYYNSTGNTIFMQNTPNKIGTFKLKVIATEGSSTVRNTEYKSTDTSSALFGSAKQDLTVTIAGSAAHTCTGVLQNGLEPTENNAGYLPYYKCSCGRFYEDESCSKEIEVLDQWKQQGGDGYLPMLTPLSNAQYFASLTLNENINVNFKMTGMSQNFDLSKLVVTLDKQTVSVSKNESGEVVGLLKAVAPKDMGKPMTIEVKYDNKVEKTIADYSVKKYCQTVLTSESYGPESKLGKLCKAVLNYGKWAEDYFNEKGQIPAAASTVNEGYVTDFDSVTIPQTSGSFTASAAVTGAGGYLTLNSTIALNFEIKTIKTLTEGDLLILNNEGKKVDPNNITLTEIEGGYKIRISNIGASKLSRTYTLTIKGDTASVTYSVYTYCYNAQSNPDEAFTATLKTLCKAIYSYGEAAKAYTASLSN